MKRHIKVVRQSFHEVVITHDELKSIVANHLQNDVLTHAPMLPALKLTFKCDAASNIMVIGEWNEAID